MLPSDLLRVEKAACLGPTLSKTSNKFSFEKKSNKNFLQTENKKVGQISQYGWRVRLLWSLSSKRYSLSFDWESTTKKWPVSQTQSRLIRISYEIWKVL